MMAHEASNSAPGSTQPEAANAWVQAGATFLEAGEAHRITRIDEDAVHGVSPTGASWIWSMPGFLEALRRGDIAQAAANESQRPPRPKRQLARDATTRERLVAIRDHPLVQHCGDDLALIVLRTFRALRRGDPAEPPHLRVLSLAAQAGALARGLGPHVANPPRASGRPPRYLEAARDIQPLLGRLDTFLAGDGDLDLAELQQLEALARQGIATIHDLEARQPVPIGRPPERWPSVRAVRSRLAVQRRNIARGTYRLADAIREVAEREVLQRKRIAAGWCLEDMERVRLGADDAEAVRFCVEQIESALHGTYGTAMSEDEMLGYRQAAAITLRLKRQQTRDLPLAGHPT